MYSTIFFLSMLGFIGKERYLVGDHSFLHLGDSSTSTVHGFLGCLYIVPDTNSPG